MNIKTLTIALVGFLGMYTLGSHALALDTPAVDLGSNPVFTLSGQAYASGTPFSSVIATAPSNLDMLITDIQLSSCCATEGSNVTLTTSSGTIIGRWSVGMNTPFSAAMVSGLLLPAGESLTLSATRNNASNYVYYTFAGQYIRP